MTTGIMIHTTEGLNMTVTQRTKQPVIPNQMKVISDSQEYPCSAASVVVSTASIASGEDQQGEVLTTRV